MTSGPRQCRKARKREIPFNCKFHAGHEGNCSPYTLPPSGNYLTRGLPDEQRGYVEQTAWLRGKSIPDAEHALAERLATLADIPYNRGGNAATADWIARERRFLADIAASKAAALEESASPRR